MEEIGIDLPLFGMMFGYGPYATFGEQKGKGTIYIGERDHGVGVRMDQISLMLMTL